MAGGKIDFESIARAALASARSLVSSWLPNGNAQGHEWIALNPMRADARPGNFSVNLSTGQWSDFAMTDVAGGDLISLYAYLNRLKQGAAAKHLAAELGLTGVTGVNGNGDRGDSKPSLSITELAAAKGLPLAFLKQHGVEQSGRFVKFTCYRMDGTQAPRYRLRDKLSGERKYIWNNDPDKRAISLYGAETLHAFPGRSLDLVEGETDRLSALLHDRNCLGLPGCSMAKTLTAEHLVGFDEAFIYQEPDEGGVTLRTGLLRRLKRLDFRGVVKVVRMPADIKDLNALHMRCLGEPGAFEAELAGLIDAAETVELGATASEESDPRPLQFSDDALALEFAAEHSGDLRFVATLNDWMQYRGSHWQRDETLHVFDLIRASNRRLAAQAADVLDPKTAEKVCRVLASAKTIAAVHTLARSDRRIAATVDQWDADNWLLNTPAGVLDLRDGSLKGHRPVDYMTQITSVAPAPAGTYCPLWHAFLLRVFAGDAELIAFLQRAVGYSLTGSTRDHAVFFLYGTGANGKTVFVNVIRSMFNSYATSVPMDALTETANPTHPTDLADLRGVRFVSATETEEGRRWAEARIKLLTGGEHLIKARRMRQDNFEFSPAFKLFISGNHRPALRNVDEATRRRFHMVPFGVTIPLAERDTELTQKLLRELPAILSWAIAGCREWQTIGLAPPAIVTQATDHYFEGEDTLALWIAENCSTAGNDTATTRDLFADWKLYTERTGEFTGSQKRFVHRLEERGFVHGWRCPATDRMGFYGIKVRHRPAEWQQNAPNSGGQD